MKLERTNGFVIELVFDRVPLGCSVLGVQRGLDEVDDGNQPDRRASDQTLVEDSLLDHAMKRVQRFRYARKVRDDIGCG